MLTPHLLGPVGQVHPELDPAVSQTLLVLTEGGAGGTQSPNKGDPAARKSELQAEAGVPTTQDSADPLPEAELASWARWSLSETKLPLTLTERTGPPIHCGSPQRRAAPLRRMHPGL